jgi:hypothetical protein
MMQMLAAGGLPLLTDGRRAADPDNPRGYYEWEPVKRLPQEPAGIAQAEGKAVKVVSSLLPALPADRRYHVLFMRRPLEEVLASQTAMIRRLGTAAPARPAPAMAAALQAHVAFVTAWLARQSHLTVAWVEYHAVLDDPRGEAERIQGLLELPLDPAAMAAQVDPALWRQRLGPERPIAC